MMLPFASGTFPTKYRSLGIVATLFILLLTFWQWSGSSRGPSVGGAEKAQHVQPTDLCLGSARKVADYMGAYPLDKADFGEMGKRLQILKEWIAHREAASLTQEEEDAWSTIIESAAMSLVPFIQSPFPDHRPLERLRDGFVPGSRGIVITTGKKCFRYACHLVAGLREVLGSRLPIQVVYAGERDLPTEYRDFITSRAANVTTLDITSVFDDTTLDLANAGWAVKAFAILGSTFEQVILLDADAVFVQPPEVIFDVHPQYAETGTLLFHDRLLWQGAFKERHSWWEKELAHTELSSTIRQSKVFVEKYAEEGDSGVVAVDKSRLDVFIGLLHIGWQNTKDVRDAFTYVQGHGDKESWWFGFELAATPYSMEQHYAAIMGHIQIGPDGRPEDRVCSFAIAHVDHNDRLLWYNGSLLKNKEIDAVDFDVPTEWMIDGIWEKGATKQDMSCMNGTEVKLIDADTVTLIQSTVNVAKRVDHRLRPQFPDVVP